MAVRERCGIFDVSHMGEIETRRPAGAGAAAAAALQRRRGDRAVGGAQYSVLCREDGGVLDDLFTYRLERRPLPDGHQRRQPRARPRVVSRPRGGASRRARCSDRIEDYAMLAVQGPLAREIVQAISDAPLPPRMTPPRGRLAGVEVLVCGTGYTGEDGVELLCAPADAPRAVGRARAPRRHAGRARRARHAAPGGVLPPLRQRPDGRARADRSRARLVLQGGHRLHRRRGRARRARPRARPRSSSRSRSRARGSRARATRSWAAARSPAARSRRAWASASAWPTCPPSAPRRGPPRDRRSWQDAPRRRQGQAALQKGRVNGRGQLPRGSALPPRARLGADRRRAIPQLATLGITWYAQDSLGEVVFFEPPAVGTRAEQGRALRRGRVGEGRLRRDRAARPARSSRSTRRSPRTPRSINEDPYGEGWLVKIRLSDPAEREALLDAAAYRATLAG